MPDATHAAGEAESDRRQGTSDAKPEDVPVEISLPRRLVAEALGTAFLLVGVVGSGILGDRLAGGNVGVALLANALATTGMLYALIHWFGPISGAHLNPLVSAAMAVRGEISSRAALGYGLAQLGGAFLGVGVADAMFGMPIYALSTQPRGGPAILLSEFVATFGLIGIVWTCAHHRLTAIAGIVAAYIGGGFWFTATGFANPAVTIARATTETFSGIRPADVPGFLAVELLGAVCAILLFRWLIGPARHGEGSR